MRAEITEIENRKIEEINEEKPNVLKVYEIRQNKINKIIK